MMDLVLRERRMAVSEREWKHRLRGYGYAIRDTDEGRVVTSILRGDALCGLPAQLVA
ncbi:hypothetical protein K1T73_03570 [Roseovarius sp. SCSIO 43702]|uniref:hypothetical protein n=1 Tax=Roseovarius sp. SCSIO 43702 TaxID=2823043 RepID=UPI001C72E697|nr:hypothetical protein [Roseovarius sp. SCSIO 43702]QYX58710.1 hypothetical protein K1T73_03570 [Roseovarius sp. SCSIO 43702]